MEKPRILVVDDETDIRELLSYHLGRSGFLVQTAASGEEAIEALRDEAPDLIVLDLMLPGVDGLDFCRMVRRSPRTAGIPILMLTARDDETDVVTGLELGADDYLTKPFSPKVLTARIRAILRRRRHQSTEDRPSAETSIRSGNVLIDPGRRRVWIEEKEIPLTYTEFNILYFLARRPDWVYSRRQIIEAVRGDDYPVTERSVDVQIAGLRKKLGSAGERLETVRGVGYRFRSQ